MYVFQLFDAYSASGSALLWVALFEGIAIGWIYGEFKFPVAIICVISGKALIVTTYFCE